MWWDHGIFAQLYLRRLDEELDREAWINGLKRKWGLVCIDPRE